MAKNRRLSFFSLLLTSLAALALCVEQASAQLGEDPDHADAKGLMARKKWDEAVIALRKLHKSEPDSAEVSIDLAKALTYSGRREEALSLLAHDASRQKGTARASLTRRSRVLSRMFLTQSTQQAYQDGLSLAIAKKYRQARERFEKALEQEPDNVELLVRVGQCLLLENDVDSAAERLKLARKLNSSEPEIRLWLGKALRDRGELKEALEELKLASAQLEGSELAPTWYAEALAQSGQKLAALELLETNLRQNPFHLQALVAHARLKFQGAERTEPQTLLDIRKELQLALSRIDQYKDAKIGGFEGSLGLDLRDPKTLRSEIETLMERVESRIDSLKS